MTTNGIKKIGGAILGLLLFCGITLISSTTAQAQYPWNQDQYRQDQYRREQRERERQAQIERERRARQSQQQSGYYDQYGNWHSTGYSNQSQQQSGYYDQYGNWRSTGYSNQQNGYYNQGYRGRNRDGYGNQGGSYELRQTALNAGYNEGLKAGREDRRRGRYSPSHSVNSLKDYNSRMGDRATYQQYFLQAYQNGYADGYRGV